MGWDLCILWFVFIDGFTDIRRESAVVLGGIYFFKGVASEPT
jgi:hypothetical protein